MRLRFGDVTFDLGRRAVFRGPQLVHLPSKSFRLLELLLSRRPDAVSKEEIFEAVWPEVVVSEGSLATLVKELRRALGERVGGTAWIRTVHGYGYAFDAPVREAPEPAPAAHRHVLVWGVRELELSESENSLGREPTALAWVGHPSVSREHARVVVTSEKAEIEDLGSKNGTWLGSRRTEGRVPLADGDEIRVGEVRLVYRGPASGISSATKTAR